jgi:hypothetical protein
MFHDVDVLKAVQALLSSTLFLFLICIVSFQPLDSWIGKISAIDDVASGDASTSNLVFNPKYAGAWAVKKYNVFSNMSHFIYE